MANPDSPSAQLGLINSSQAMIPVSGVVRGCVGVGVGRCDFILCTSGPIDCVHVSMGECDCV